MPLRFLEYYVHLLYGIVPADVRYREALYQIPTPEFYVFYNGKSNPKEKEYIMKLSDAFIEPQNEPLCELKVRFITITNENAQNLPVVQKCDILKQYCEFMNIVMRYHAEMQDQPTGEERQGAYEKAIREAISKGILTDYLTRKGTEVMNMFIDEYDYDLDMKVKAEEAEKRGQEQKAVEAALLLINKYKATPEDAAKDVDAPLELVLEALKEKA